MSQTVLRRQAPQAPDTTIDTAAVLDGGYCSKHENVHEHRGASAETVEESAKKLRRLIQKTAERQENTVGAEFSEIRIFPRKTKDEKRSTTLKSRIELFFLGP